MEKDLVQADAKRYRLAARRLAEMRKIRSSPTHATQLVNAVQVLILNT